MAFLPANIPRIEITEIFRFDPERPVDDLLKKGLLKAFTFHIDRKVETANHIRTATIVALQILASIAPPLASRNLNFFIQIWRWVCATLQRGIDPVAEGVIAGMWTILRQAQDSAGLFIDLWEQHVELFAQLAEIYDKARLEDLDQEKGYYSHGLAIEEGLKSMGLVMEDKVWMRHAVEGAQLRSLVVWVA